MFKFVHLRARAAAGAALLAFLLAGPAIGSVAAQDPATPPPAQEAPAQVVVDSVLVRGNQRVSEQAIVAAAGIRGGESIAAPDVQRAIRRLMATGNFETVQVLTRGDPAAGVDIVFEVVERPLIADIQFRGLESVSAGTVRDTVGLEENQPLDPALVARTQQTIRDMLAEEGVQLVSVDTTLAPVGQPAGAYRLTFDVREGNRLSIADVDFRGNQAFPDAELVDAIDTQPEGFLWFRTGRFDREVFRADLRERLPEFYGEHGYIDFAVVSDTLIVDPQTGKARIVVEVAEGPQYRLGEFVVEGSSRFPDEQLARLFTARRRTVLGLPFGPRDDREAGEVFNRRALRAATQQVQQLYQNEGYLYAQVEPVIQRVPAETPGAAPTVDVTWAVSERSPFYVNRVSIEGNTYTDESVIRDRLVMLPGDVYSEERLLRSYESIAGLGYFETPLPLPDIRPNPDSGTVDIVFRVKEKQTGNINFGTAFGGGDRGGGLSGFLGYNQPNLFGEGKQASFRAEYGFRRNSVELSYTDPNLLGTRRSGSVSLFHTGDRIDVGFDDGRRLQTGGSVQVGLPLPNLRWTRAFLGYSLSRQQYIPVDEGDCEEGVANNLFCLPDATASTVSIGVTRDTKNHPLFPTAGTSQSTSLRQTGGPLGGDGNFQKLTNELEWWVPVGQIGGDTPGSRPIRFTLGLQARTGMIFGDATSLFFQRFALGGTPVGFGEQLRGYGTQTITPLGYVPEGRQGRIPNTARLGDAFMTVSAEYAVRLNDAISVSLFGEAGNVWSDPRFIDPTRLFRGAGLGGTVQTPFGPIGLDYAYGFDRIDPLTGERGGWEFHFKFGGGF